MEKPGRLLSLDTLRGFDMFFIMGLPGLIVAFSNLFGWGTAWWLPVQMQHVVWHGWHLMDGVFPVFLFVAGVSWPFSLASRRAKGVSNAALCGTILRRVLILFVLGLFCEGITHINLGWQSFRFGSVLGRIGFAWGAAALLTLFFKARTRLVIAAVILAACWALMLFVPVPDAAEVAARPPATKEVADLIATYGTGPFSVTGSWEGWFDRRFLPGRMRYDGLMDTQGLLSILPAICLPLFGTLAGECVRRADLSGARKTLHLAIAAVISSALGYFLAHGLGPWNTPFNRSLWTSSHILWSAGYALALFAAFYWIIDVKGWRRWTFFFRVIGMNAIAVWMLTRLYSIGGYPAFMPLKDANRWLFGGVAELLPPTWGALVMAVGFVAVHWGFLYFLYRKNIFFKV